MLKERLEFNLSRMKMAVASYKDTARRALRSPMRKTFSMLGFTLVILIFFIMGAIRPTLKTISKLRAEIKEREVANQQLQAKIDTINELQSKYEEMETDLEVVELYFPPDMDYSLVMASLEKVTERYGFTMKNLSIRNDERAKSKYKNMGYVNFSMNVSGRLSNLVKLLKHLEGMPVVPNMLSVSYSPLDQNEDEEIDVAINMSMYRTE